VGSRRDRDDTNLLAVAEQERLALLVVADQRNKHRWLVRLAIRLDAQVAEGAISILHDAARLIPGRRSLRAIRARTWRAPCSSGGSATSAASASCDSPQGEVTDFEGDAVALDA
jgi:hypothetical protein